MNEPAALRPPFAIRTVAVIGAGVAGRSFALACAAAGFHVVLEDVMPANLRKAEADYADLCSAATVGSRADWSWRRRWRMPFARLILPWTLYRMSWSRSWRSSA